MTRCAHGKLKLPVSVIRHCLSPLPSCVSAFTEPKRLGSTRRSLGAHFTVRPGSFKTALKEWRSGRLFAARRADEPPPQPAPRRIAWAMNHPTDASLVCRERDRQAPQRLHPSVMSEALLFGCSDQLLCPERLHKASGPLRTLLAGDLAALLHRPGECKNHRRRCHVPGKAKPEERAENPKH